MSTAPALKTFSFSLFKAVTTYPGTEDRPIVRTQHLDIGFAKNASMLRSADKHTPMYSVDVYEFEVGTARGDKPKQSLGPISAVEVLQLAKAWALVNLGAGCTPKVTVNGRDYYNFFEGASALLDLRPDNVEQVLRTMLRWDAAFPGDVKAGDRADSPTQKSIDWVLLRSQKQSLVAMASDASKPASEIEVFDGVIALLDHIQDDAVAKGLATEQEVFGVSLDTENAITTDHEKPV